MTDIVKLNGYLPGNIIKVNQHTPSEIVLFNQYAFPSGGETIGPANWVLGQGVWDGSKYESAANGSWKVEITSNFSGIDWHPTLVTVIVANDIGWSPLLQTFTITDTSTNTIHTEGTPIVLDGDAVDTTIGMSPSYVGNNLYHITFDGGSNKFYVKSIIFSDA